MRFQIIKWSLVALSLPVTFAIYFGFICLFPPWPVFIWACAMIWFWCWRLLLSRLLSLRPLEKHLRSA